MVSPRRCFCVALLALCLSSIAAAPHATPAGAQAEVEDESIPAPLVIDTRDGNAVDDDPLIADALAAVQRQQQIEREIVRETLREQAVPPGGLTVTYLTTPPDDVRLVVEAAAVAWESVLVTSNAGPVEIEFDWRILPANILGLAAPTSFERSPDLPQDVLYPVALANTLLETDRAPGRAEINITLASNLYGVSNGWHVDPTVSSDPMAPPSSPVPGQQLDLFTVVIHEIGHGLGFTGSARNGQLHSELVVYDVLARANGVPLSQTNVEAALVSEDLFIDIGGGRTAELFAPPRFINRVSYNHFDERADAREPGGLMTPVFSRGEVNRTIDAATLGVMSGLGWEIAKPVVTPRITSVEPRGDGLVVRFTNGIGRSGQPPFAHRVTATAADGTLLAQRQPSWEAQEVLIEGLADGRGVVITVLPIGIDGPGPSASVTLSDRPTQVSVTGTGTSRSISWQPPTAPMPGDITYRIDRRLIGGPWQLVAQTQNEFASDTALGTGNYQYRVTAIVDGVAGTSVVTPIEGVTEGIVRSMSLDGQVTRLYQAFFGRSPDTAGLAFWLEQRAGGADIESIATAFADSDEFRALAGEPDNGAFVDDVYRNVLGRAPDAEGRSFWIDRLDNGLPRGDLVVAFSEAPEFVLITNTAAPTVGSTGAVTRLYWAFFQRPPDPEGVAFWTDEIDNGRAPLSAVSNAFTNSPEFAATYGTLSNQEFLDLVYDNVLGRRADDGGFNYWLTQLENGRERGDVMLAFANSPEFILKTGTLP